MSVLSGLVQEGLLSLLLYDKEYGIKVCSMVPVETYDGPFRRFAKKAIVYWQQFKQPPGEHAVDICEELEQDDPKRAEQTRILFESIQESKDGINAKYILNRAAEFIRGQGLRTGIIEAVGLLEQDKLGEAEEVIHKAIKGKLNLFDPGLIYSKTSVWDIVTDDVEPIPTGIKQLDDKKLGPASGELHLLIAPSNYGKSWWLMHLGKSALMHHKRVCYVSLEMNEKKIASRFLQSFCAMTKRKEKNLVQRVFDENEAGQFCGIDSEDLEKVSALSEISTDADLAKWLKKRHSGFSNRPPLVIKQFPTGSLTTQQLVGYLESLESQTGILPDLLLLDYPDLMQLGTKQEHRIALGTVFQELRGLAIERNIAVAVVSQTNRQALGKKLITEKDVAEDYSKIATADIAISYNQTDEERKLGLARLYVMKARNEEKGFVVLISQNYAMGQFCVSSARMLSGYWKAVEQESTGARGRGYRRKPKL